MRFRRSPARAGEQAFLSTSPDLSAAFSVGYDPKEQVIYLAVIVRDDQLIVGNTSAWDTDAMEVYVDGLHSETVRGFPQDPNWNDNMDAGEAPVLQYIGIPGKPPVYGIKKSAGVERNGEDNPILMFGDIHKTKTRMAFRRQGDVTTYEWAVQAFDHYPDKPTKLLPGVQIGFDVVVVDKDKPAQTPLAQNDPEEDRQAWVCWGPPWRSIKFFDAANLGEIVLGRAADPVIGREFASADGDIQYGRVQDELGLDCYDGGSSPPGPSNSSPVGPDEQDAAGIWRSSAPRPSCSASSCSSSTRRPRWCSSPRPSIRRPGESSWLVSWVLMRSCLPCRSSWWSGFLGRWSRRSAGKGRSYAAHLALLRKRLRGNPHHRVASLEDEGAVERAIERLDEEAVRIARMTASQVFVSTAVSQSGRLDTFLVLSLQTRMVWKIARLYNQRPSLREMVHLYANVAGTAFAAGEIQDVDLSEQIEPVFSAVIGSLGGAVPGFQLAASILANSVLSGAADAFLTLRVGMITKRYCGALVVEQPATLRRKATSEAAEHIGAIVAEGTARVTRALWSHSKARSAAPPRTPTPRC